VTGYRISKQFTFDASHQLDTLPAGHKCARLHGHTYRAEIVLAAADVDEHGFIIDFADLTSLGTYIAGHLDHRHLNDVLEVPATSENLARHLYDWCTTHLNLPSRAYAAAVRVSETPATWAEYSGDAS
jgi:6-pyruvoyltetrahydropterin/6-carboxytetrahydropterin synthase